MGEVLFDSVLLEEGLVCCQMDEIDESLGALVALVGSEELEVVHGEVGWL